MLDALNSRLLSWPPDFAPSRKLARIIERRRDALHNGAIDWGHAEALLFGSLLVEGIGVRITDRTPSAARSDIAMRCCMTRHRRNVHAAGGHSAGAARHSRFTTARSPKPR